MHPGRLSRRVAVAALSAGFWGCSGQPDVTSPPGASASTVVEFELPDSGLPDYGTVPFPSDLYLEDGHVSPDIPGLSRLVSLHSEAFTQGLATLDGFGRTTTSELFATGDVDRASLPADGESLAADVSVTLVDVDPASPELGTRYPVRVAYLPSLRCISVLPEAVLPPGVRYATVVTTRVHAADGTSLGADRALQDIERTGAAGRQSAAEKLYGDALDRIVAAGVVERASDVAGLAVFTTSKLASELAGLRERLRDPKQFPPPQLLLDAAGALPYSAVIFGVQSNPDLDAWLGTADRDPQGNEWPGVDNAGGIAHDFIGAIASGAFVSPSFLDAASGHFEHAADGSVRVADAAAKVPVTLVVPKAAPPAAGYPVVMFGHGLANDRGQMLAIANELARGGFAVIGIDDVQHGLRTGIPDAANSEKGSYQGPDGLPDHAGLPLGFFGGLNDFVAIRDNFRQTVVDEMNLVRLVENPALDLSPLAPALGTAAPKLDPGHIYYDGGSLGGMVGTITVAVEPGIRAAALQVPGGGFVDLIATNSDKMHGLVSTLAGGTFGIQGDAQLDEFHPAVNLMAEITEPGDPLDYAPSVYGDPLPGIAPRKQRPSVLISYSVDDEVMSNLSTHALIRAFGLPLAHPALVPLSGVKSVDAPVSGNMQGATAAAVQYSPSTHALGTNRFDWRQYMPGDPQPDPDNRWPEIPAKIHIELPIRELDRQVVHFFQSGMTSAAPEIIITKPPVADYDADGVTDADEKTAGTDPYNPDSH